jgi:uncharacterized protein (TIGR02147 family)
MYFKGRNYGCFAVLFLLPAVERGSGIMDGIFAYADYRDFLRDHYQTNKESHRFFSLRYIARKTGIDASYYIKILKKKKHLSDRAIAVLIDFLKLEKRQAEFFTTLVHFNKARGREEELLYFERLVSLREPAAKTIDGERYEYFSSWLNVALREELNILSFDGNVGDLASRFQPAVGASHARRSIALLEKLGIIRKRQSGGYELVDPFIVNDGAARPSEIRSFQKEMIALGSGALDRLAKQDRDISTLTVSTSRECFETICERLAEIRNEIMELVRKEPKAEEVYQINFQVFPLTRNAERDKKAK